MVVVCAVKGCPVYSVQFLGGSEMAAILPVMLRRIPLLEPRPHPHKRANKKILKKHPHKNPDQTLIIEHPHTVEIR